MKEKEMMDLYTKAICNAHGTVHPEVFEVRKLYLQLDAAHNKTEIFRSLRKITDNYKVPDNVCETYETVYKNLEEKDKNYFKNEVKR